MIVDVIVCVATAANAAAQAARPATTQAATQAAVTAVMCVHRLETVAQRSDCAAGAHANQHDKQFGSEHD